MLLFGAILVITLQCTLFVKSDTDTCILPSGSPGSCVKQSKCRPINHLRKKKHKTLEERLYIKQTKCFTNSTSTIIRKNTFGSEFDIYASELEEYHSLNIHLPFSTIKIQTKVCCPPLREWVNFVPKPALAEASSEAQPPNAEPPKAEPPKAQTPKVKIKNRHSKSYADRERERVCGFDSTTTNRIIGGDPTGVDQYPWVVLLEYFGGTLNCGGSLVTSRFVLTAAHCIDSRFGMPLFVRLGEYNTSSFPTDRVQVAGGGYETVNVTIVTVESTYAHALFNRTSFAHDIGMVKLTRNVAFSQFINIICVSPRDYFPQFTTETKFTVAGWGDTRGGTPNDVKRAVQVPFVPTNECKSIRDNVFSEFQICAGGEDGKDSCYGDSGGPLMYETNQLHYIVGVVSHGSKYCGLQGEPAIYTYVYKYIGWISDVVNGYVKPYRKY